MKKWQVLGFVLAIVALTALSVGVALAQQRPVAEGEGFLNFSDQAVGQRRGDWAAESQPAANQDNWDGAQAIAQTEGLTDAEIEGILYMREEEKLARDVYLTLYEAWGIRIFQNIADSEASHMEAVKTLIDRYGLDDPAADTEIGVFENRVLQALYDQLIVQGSQSLADALKVGAAIEEIDILDLEERIAETDKADIQQVYQNLDRGSRNHLRAFVTSLERQTGETYEPQYLDSEAFEAIVTAQTERGGGDGGGGNGGSRGGRGSGSRRPGGAQGKERAGNQASGA